MNRLILAFGIALLAALPAYAVQPDEVLDDPVLEQRARDLSKGLRCLVCQNESIDESNASLARDLRILVRDRLVAGDTDEEALDFIVERYGEFVLLQPTTGGANWLLWAAGPIMLLIASAAGFSYLRRRSRAVPQGTETLSAEEQQRISELLKE
ncbi:MAG: cytochrome c-type biogenesis protein CcmH [Rhodobacteraceae bacterium]|nr:cytochrome c-type biogenesis protein CcmH [Paracoccaceae bacterium]